MHISSYNILIKTVFSVYWIQSVNWNEFLPLLLHKFFISVIPAIINSVWCVFTGLHKEVVAKKVYASDSSMVPEV